MLYFSFCALALIASALADSPADSPAHSPADSPADYPPQALPSEIKDLPNRPAGASFREFSGYIPVSKDGSRKLFYWFVEAQSSPETKPLLLWTNGGPGCSGLGGFMSEQGPYRADSKGNLSLNSYAWNKLANVIFIEQPAGVGFSTNTDKHFKYNDTQAANDNLMFLQNWFKMYSNYAKTPFYITSESYGGHYMPTLALAITESNSLPNFKGFAVGNPLTYMPYRNLGQYGTFGGHNLLPKPSFDQYMQNDCWKLNSGTAPPAHLQLCQNLTEQFDDLTSGLDPYALDFPVCNPPGAKGQADRHALLKFMSGSKYFLGRYFPANYQPCAGDYGGDYLNRKDVQAAIHVEGSPKWEMCSDFVGENYNQDDVNAPMMPIYHKLIASTTRQIDILVYSGDDDSVCATLGSQQWIWGMNMTNPEPWKAYNVGGQVAGYTTYFENEKTLSGFRFTTVHGAGHMVPQTRPEQSLAVLKSFLDQSLQG